MRIPSEDLQKRIIDTIRYRFYDRLDLYDVYRWLDNFQDDEQEMAVSVLEKLEYYREEDLLGILFSKLNTISEDVWREFQKPFRNYKMKQIREFCYKCGQQICRGRELGYSNSQALVLFAHAVPNNTLPIIWVDKYEDNGVKKYWQPLIAMDQLKKQNMAFI